MTRTATIALPLAIVATCWAQGEQQYHAKLAVESSAELPGTPLITAPPLGQEFPPCKIVNIFANGLIVYIVPVIIDPSVDRMSRRWDDKCGVTIWLKGYRKAAVTLHDGAVITLEQIGDPEGSTVSVTALHVPRDAAKAYDKGLTAMSDNKLPAAQKQFERAVALYPDYAQAWSQLGEVLEQQSQPKEAADACQHALTADPKYIRPYLQLIRMAVTGKRMEEAVTLGDQAIAQNPLEFPGIYYYYADANYELKHLDIAEKTARRAIELDKSTDYPLAEALLGKILADKGDTHGAIEHLNKYLQLAPKAEDAQAIRERIAGLQSGQTPPEARQ